MDTSGTGTYRTTVNRTLNNRLAQMSPDRNETQPYGLIGPVRLVPYADEAIHRRTRPRLTVEVTLILKTGFGLGD